MFSCIAATDCYEPSTTSVYIRNGDGHRRRRRHGEISPTVAFESFELAVPAVAVEDQQHQQREDPPAKKSSSSSKTVSFNETTLIHPTLHVADYSMEEMERTWYSRKSLKDIKLKLRDCLQSLEERPTAAIAPTSSRMILGGVIALDHRDDDDDARDDDDSNKENSRCAVDIHNNMKESNDCFRGLEGKTIEGQIKKRMLKENAKDVVFREQSFQKWLFKEGGQESIAREYAKAAELSRASAICMAQKDAKEVQALWRSERSQHSNLPTTSGRPHAPKGHAALKSVFVPRNKVLPPLSPRMASLLDN